MIGVATAMDNLLDQLADMIAERVIERQKAEAVKSRTVYLTPQQMAERMGLTVGRLANMRSAKIGPKFVKRGRRVQYPVTPDQTA